MRIIIVGGGKVGGYLARQLVEVGHAVAVTERNPEVARRLGEDLGALVLEGDGTDPTVLASAEVDRADWLVAVTGQDDENLVACQLGSTLGAGRVLARMNDPRNRSAFDALHIPVVAVTDLIGEVIEREVDLDRLDRIALIAHGHVSLVEVEIPEGVAPRQVKDTVLPPGTVLVTVVREDEIAVPGPATILRAGDHVLAVTELDREPDVRAALCDPSAGNDAGV